MSKRYLFTGEESYLLRKELHKWMTSFREKYGEDTVKSVSLDTYTPSDIMQILCSGGLFHTDQMIVVYDMPGSTTSPKWTSELETLIMENWTQIYPDYFVVFVSEKPDKRKKIYKFLTEQCEVKIFASMDMRSLPSFVQKEFAEYCTVPVILSKEQIEYLIELVGTDGRRLSNEIQKLAFTLNAKPNTIIDKVLIDSVVSPSQESTAFELLDALLHIPSPTILDTVWLLIQMWEAWQAIHGGLLWGLKNMIAYALCIQHGNDPKTLWLAPFVIGKYNKYQSTLIAYLSAYQQLYNVLLDYEYRIKSGQIDDKWYWLHLKDLLYRTNFLN